MASRASEIDSACIFSSDQRLLPGLSYSAFAYPGDQEALGALSKVPGAPALLTYLQKNLIEEIIYVENNEHMIRVNEQNYGSLFKLVNRCCEILSCPLPEIYLKSNPELNAYTVGHRRTSIVLHSALVDALTSDELSFVIAHELGHIKCGHGLYRQLGDLLVASWDAVSSMIPVPGLGLVRIPLLIAYWEWFRRAELSCDRAGLLCVQTLNPALTGLAKLAGRVHGLEEEFHVDSVLAQAEVHHDVNKLALVLSILKNVQNSHPFVPNRLKQAKNFGNSEEYRRILQGDYKRDLLGLHEGGQRIKCACGQELNVKLKFCSSCGRPVQAGVVQAEVAKACKVCGSPTDAGMKFCVMCGTSNS